MYLVHICVRERRLDLDRDGFPQVVGGSKRCNEPKTAFIFIYVTPLLSENNLKSSGRDGFVTW